MRLATAARQGMKDEEDEGDDGNRTRGLVRARAFGGGNRAAGPLRKAGGTRKIRPIGRLTSRPPFRHATVGPTTGDRDPVEIHCGERGWRAYATGLWPRRTDIGKGSACWLR